MRNLLLILVITLTFLSCSNDKRAKEESKTKITTSTVEAPKVSVKEELPPLKECKSDIGKVKSNLDHSIGTKTEFTELAKLLKNKDCDVIEITWNSLSPPERDYDPMPLKLVYNRTEGILKSIFTQTNVIEEYNNVNEKCLMEFLKKGNRDFYALSDFCKDMKYDFNNREMNQTAIGEKPEQSELDGSVKIVKDFIKANAKDASSIEFLEWSKVSSLGENWIVRCKYKGTNSFGAVVTDNSWFYIQDNKVVDTKTIE